MAYTDDEIKWVFGRTDGRCLYCGTHLLLDCYGLIGDRGGWEINYFVPRLNNGERRTGNWVPACIPCDAIKGDCFPWEYDARKFREGDENPDNYVAAAK